MLFHFFSVITVLILVSLQKTQTLTEYYSVHRYIIEQIIYVKKKKKKKRGSPIWKLSDLCHRLDAFKFPVHGEKCVYLLAPDMRIGSIALTLVVGRSPSYICSVT